MNDQERRSSIRGNITLALISTLVAVLILSAVGEVMVRYRERNRDSTPGTMPLLFYKHERLGHALVRDYDYFGWARINRDGFRGEPLVDRDSTTLRIVAIGGSTTFDSQVSGNDRTWPARLQYWLRASAPDLGVEVVNAGTPGYRVIDNSIRLLTELPKYCPDLIILYHAHNDLIRSLRGDGGGKPGNVTSAVTQRPGEVEALTPWTRWLSRHSLLYTKLRTRLKVIGRTGEGSPEGLADGRREVGSSPPGGEDARVVRGANEFERDVGAFLAIAQASGIPVLVVEVVAMGSPAARDDAEESRILSRYYGQPAATVAAGYEAFRRAAESAARDYGVAFLPTTDFGLDGKEWYAEDDAIHFNDAGANRFGEALADALLASPELRGLEATRTACRHAARP